MNLFSETFFPDPVGTTRGDLQREFQDICLDILDGDQDISASDLALELIPRLVGCVPEEAFAKKTLEGEGIIFVHGAIEEDLIGELQQRLYTAHLNLQAGKPIQVYLTSPGGEVVAGMALISTIQQIQRQGRKVAIHIQGEAASMGSVLLQSADHRSVESYSTLLIHELSFAMEGSTSAHRNERVNAENLEKILLGMYSSRTGKTPSYYKKKIKNKDWVLSAEEALAEGLVDEVVYPPRLKG